MKRIKEAVEHPAQPEWVPRVWPYDRFAAARALRTYRNRAWFARQLMLGKTAREIAAITGVSMSAIQSWKIRHNLQASREPVLPMPQNHTKTRKMHGDRRVQGNVSNFARRTYANRTWLAAALRTQSQSATAISLGVCVATIRNWRARFNIPALPSYATRVYLSKYARATYANRAWLLAELEKGKTYGVIAAATRVSRETIVNWVRRQGFNRGTSTAVPALKTYANRAWLAAKVAEGLRDREIAELVSVTTTAIGNRRRSFGIAANQRRIGLQPAVQQARRAFGTWLTPRLANLPVDEREARALTALHGIRGPVMTLREAGEAWGMSGERVRQIYWQALSKIVGAVGAAALADFPKIAALPPYVEKRDSAPI